MSKTYKQLKNELLDQSTYTLKEVEHRLDMVMLHAADIAQASFVGDPSGYYISGRTDAANAIKKEVGDE